ncbi:MAG: lipoyl synthase [Finegoldia sp.]|nr:lipoyl synthase [Finegoldia sp.]
MLRKPEWMKIKIEGGENFHEVESLVDGLELNTVCTHADCPNKMKCYESRTATFMILGDHCTRNCRYCDVECGKPREVKREETIHVAEAVKQLGLKYAVITSVTRDDLADEGATQFKNVIADIRELNPDTKVEVLIPDMHAKHELLDIVMDERPDVLNHNVETIERLFPEIRPQGNYRNALEVLRYAKEEKNLITKSGFMVGLGESNEEVHKVLDDLKEVGVDIVTIGQYLMPTRNHYELDRYVTPDEFDEYKAYGESIGIAHVESGPFVRSSYDAGNVFRKLKEEA